MKQITETGHFWRPLRQSPEEIGSERSKKRMTGLLGKTKELDRPVYPGKSTKKNGLLWIAYHFEYVYIFLVRTKKKTGQLRQTNVKDQSVQETQKERSICSGRPNRKTGPFCHCYSLLSHQHCLQIRSTGQRATLTHIKHRVFVCIYIAPFRITTMTAWCARRIYANKDSRKEDYPRQTRWRV